ncbi:MAG: (2Fe-2S)-binding protein [Pseudomonadota bacterium]|nr:(2Fe-2S)-binding protein [Pseudomonadota bacterium]
MAKIKFTQHDGTKCEVGLEEGLSLMEHARSNGVRGIDGDCGGCCACGTCHIIVDAGWAAKVSPVGEEEERMLDMTGDRQPHSRLACQIIATAELDGLTVKVPEHQF